VGTALEDTQPSAVITTLADGVRIDYDLTVITMKLSVELKLNGSALTVNIPNDSIMEYGGYSIVSLDMMPFLAAASEETEGYFLIPDGSGALFEFTDPAHRGEMAKIYDIYGTPGYEPASVTHNTEASPNVMLPVFGMKRSSDGFIAMTEEGAETARIVVNSANNIIRANYMFFNLQYRRGFHDLRVKGREISVYDRERITSDYSLRVQFLPEGAADYSGMAAAYREHLQEQGLLKPNTRPVSLALDLFMGIREDGLLFKPFVKLTTFEQAGEILTSLYGMGIKNVSTALRGWTKHGYQTEPSFFPPASALGGNSGLKELLETAYACGYETVPEADFHLAFDDEGGFSRRNDVVYQGNLAIYQNGPAFILHPEKALHSAEDFIKRASDYPNLSGIRFGSVGRFISYNYDSSNYITASEAVNCAASALQSVQTAFGTVQAQGGNLYVLPYASMVTDIPQQDMGYQFSTRDVPFYQMVVHGSVNYTGRAGNLTPDLQREVLNWVEYGYTPYFEITYESPEALLYTDYLSLFSSRYEEWRERIAEVVTTLSQKGYERIANAHMLTHSEPQKDVSRVSYDNGCVVYVNYTDTTVTVDGVTIGPSDFEITEG
jgi:hypothetical protein